MAPDSDRRSAEIDSRIDRFLLPLLLLGTIGFVYWGVLKYPYIQDDWCIVYSLLTRGAATFIGDAFSSYHQLFYRPLASAYLAAAVSVFRTDPFGIHCLALFLHWVSSLLVVAICRKVTGDAPLSWMVGFLYASAGSVHMDTLSWVAGAYDLGGALFFFLSIVLFLRHKPRLSAAVYFAGLLTKESTIVLPIVLVLLTAASSPDFRTIPSLLRKRSRELIPFIIIFAAYLIFRAPALLGEPGGGDYALRFIGPHIVRNSASYFTWSFEGIELLNLIPTAKGAIFGVVAVVCLLLYRSSGLGGPRVTALLAWYIVGVLPVVFLANHAFRYYLVYSLVPIVLLLLIFLRTALRLINSSRLLFLSVAVPAIVATTVLSHGTLAGLDALGIDVPTIDGSNNLVRKAAIVGITHDFLRRNYPTLRRGTCLVFDWIPTASFCRDAGPRLWYGDSTLRVFESDEVRGDMHGLYVVPGRRGLEPITAPVYPWNIEAIAFDGTVMRAERVEDLLRKQGERRRGVR